MKEKERRQWKRKQNWECVLVTNSVVSISDIFGFKQM